MKVKLLAAAVLAVSLAATASRAEDKPVGKDIVAIAAGNKDFSTLVTAVKEAGLVDTLKGEGPFTVFAPTNKAFEKLGDEKLKAVLADKELLKKVLLAHVVVGKAVMAKDAMGLDGKEVNGFTVKAGGDGVMIGDAKVIKTDIKATNGVIHVIDTVLVPAK